MTNQEFENYLALVSRLLRLRSAEREAIGLELRDHLESRVAELTAAGQDPGEATRRALEEFGDAAVLAQQFQLVSRNYQQRWMMRFATLSMAGLFLLSVLVMAMWPEGARFGAPHLSMAQDELEADANTASNLGSGIVPVRAEGVGTAGNHSRDLSPMTRRNREIDQKLATNIALDYQETPFTDVMAELGELLNVNVLLDQSARDDCLDEDEPISFTVKSIPARNALRLMLKEKNATFVVDQGVIRVISLDVASDPEYFRRRIFDCRNLVRMLEEQSGIDHLLVDGLAGDESGVAGGGGAGALPVRKTRRQYSIQVLTDMIKSAVAPGNWANTNGDASLEVVGGLAVAVATEAMLDEIGNLLQDFEHDLSK